MIDILLETFRLIGAYLLIAGIAHAFHLFCGVLSVGPQETYNQVRDYYESPLQYGIFVCSAGLVQPGRTTDTDR